MTDIITSSQNKKIKFLKTLLSTKGRKKEQKFLVEGYVVLKETIHCIKPLEVYIGEEQREKYLELINDIEKRNIPIYYVKSDILKSILPTEEPQGVVGVFSKLKTDKNIPTTGVLLYLDGIRDPGNLGGIFRSANAFGVKKIYLSKDCVDIYNSKVIRSTMASLFRIPIEYVMNDNVIDIIKEKGFKVVGLDIKGTEELSIHHCDKILYVIGNEHHGISDKLQEKVDVKFRIPMEKEVESLNVNVATSICLYEYYKQKL